MGKRAAVKRQWKRVRPIDHFERQRLTAVRLRADMRQYLQEELFEWRDPDALIARPLDDAGWQRLVAHNLKSFRGGSLDLFEQWRQRKDLRKGRTDAVIRQMLALDMEVELRSLTPEQRERIQEVAVSPKWTS